VELVDTLDLGSSAVRCESSSLSFRTKIKNENMLVGLFALLVFLILGEAIQSWIAVPVPSSIIGMVLLLTVIILRNKTPKNIKIAANKLAPLLPLFIIPISAGLITQTDIIQQHGLTLLAILTISLIPGALVTALVLKIGNRLEKKSSKT
jgi:holin-like protein